MPCFVPHYIFPIILVSLYTSTYYATGAFNVHGQLAQHSRHSAYRFQGRLRLNGAVSLIVLRLTRDLDEYEEDQNQHSTTVHIDTTLTDERVTQLFAWISRALAGDPRYNDLTTAVAAVFGTSIPELKPLVDYAMDALIQSNQSFDTILTGVPLSLAQREQASLGAMGAAQWMGIWKTRPHALLDSTNFETVDDWVKSLSRGCRRTIQKSKANEIGWVVSEKVIRPEQPAPHSSLAHFRCVLEHELRLIGKESVSDFFEAMAEAVGRYMGTTRMVGEIYEYRDIDTNRVLAFSHEVRKGNTIRGQWFYATDEASRRYVWFHSVYELVRRAIETDGIEIVDLGPSGSDAFSALKAKYGFVSVEDWTSVADYTGPFWY